MGFRTALDKDFVGGAGVAAWVTWLIAFIVFWSAGRIMYNIFFHPLRRFPGPFWHGATRWAYAIRSIRGTMPYDVLRMHEEYGPVVRVAPSELAFADPEAWKDIYGHGTASLPKWLTFYKMWDGQPPSIASATGNTHTMLRKHLGHGFSEKGMREQEPLISKYVDMLISRLHRRAGGAPQDMVAWYNWTTFDIIGDLAFGEPFLCLGKEEYHPWVTMIFKAWKENSKFIAARLLGFKLISMVMMLVSGRSWLSQIKKSKEMLKRRIQRGRRHDLVDGLIQKKDEEKLDLGILHLTASFIVTAGSETTATLLSGVTYLLLKNPEALAKVTAEVRSTFRSESEINLTSVGSLAYMKACLDEASRCYPPVPTGLPRMVPKDGTTIAGHFVPGNSIVSIFQYAASHSSSNFRDPFGFYPERFLRDERFASDKRGASQPFSTGPRDCIGRNLAYAEMRLILARVLFNFDMTLASESDDWLTGQKIYLLWHKEPLNVFLKVREFD